MSMIGILLRVSNDQLEAFLEDSTLLEEFADSEGLEESGHQLDLDKSWDALIYLVTGHPSRTLEQAQPPLSWIIFSGQMVDEGQDMGYGPAQYLTPEQVQEVSGALATLTPDDIRERYDAQRMNALEVYPSFWGDDAEEKNYVADYFNELKAFYAQAAGEGQAIISYIT